METETDFISWALFSGRNDAKAETPVLWPPHEKSWLIGKDSDAGRDWGQEEKGMTEDEMAGWHHRLNGCEFEWIPGVGAGQGGLPCCNSWGRKKSDTTERLNWTELKVTSDGDCSREIKRLAPWKKAMTNLNSILKSRDITLPTKVCTVKAMIFPVVIFGCESWTINQAERSTTDAFELWLWRRFLRVLWTAKRPNQSILKEINPE